MLPTESTEYDIIKRNMFPILLSIGPFHLASSSVFLLLSWCVFSFTFWRLMRESATPEEKTFDLAFYGTVFAFVGARAFYVLVHAGEFAQALIPIVAIWIAPGFSFYGGMSVGVGAMILLAKRLKVRIGVMLDALVPALAGGLILGKIGSFLGASEVGTRSQSPFGVWYAGHYEPRHPVQLYEIGALWLLLTGAVIVGRMAVRQRWPVGLMGSIFFLSYSILMFGLEFFKDGRLYWRGLSVNQWVLLGLFCESVGAIYVRGGGRVFLSRIVGGFYGRISKRRLR